MKPVLVTGATGFLGWHVADQLVRRGDRVRVLVRPQSRVRDLDAEPVTGDLRDPASLQRAVSGCSAVYHVAADYRLWAKNPAELYQSNVEGTRHLLNAARAARIEPFVYTSTVGCIGIPPNGLGNEDNPVTIDDMKGAYKRSKFLAEQVALHEARSGYPVIIVSPTAPVGDRDIKPTPTGKIILDFLKRQMPAYVDTGLNLIDVRDTARGHLLAAEKGKPGERYILGGENLTLQRIFERLSRLSGLPAPTIQIPYAVAFTAGVFSTAWAHISGREPRAPLDGVRMARKKMFVTTEKAKRELGFEAGPVDAALHRAIDWFRSNGYV
ncbi:MAG: NAD-dependent epimerase/dehydratase family protein [Bryobacterales bacterium]|nr:NAD-dependent epimerase/dehydratase family protein [Bryobacterales bacterium]